MSRMIFAAVICIASCVMVESLVCNTCLFALAGKCVSASSQTCSTNTSVCGTMQYSFTLTGITCGIKSLGCVEKVVCNSSSTATVLGVSTQTSSTCCTTDSCNTAQSGAPVTTMTLAVTASAALLATLLGGL